LDGLFAIIQPAPAKDATRLFELEEN